MTNTDLIQDLNVGLRVDHPRISDLVFHLISPDGTRYLLMENRGGTSTNGAGATLLTTNVTTTITNYTVLVTNITVTSASFESAAAGDYTNGMAVGNWIVTNNQVSVVTDPANAFAGNNFLALASGGISYTLPPLPPTAVSGVYSLSFAYRGPGIVSLWRGESNTNAVDSISGNNGFLTNDISFSPGEVNQAFNMGTAGFVFVPQTPSLDVGPGPGFTIDGWINPQDVLNVRPILEWSTANYYAGVHFFIVGTPPGGAPASLYANILDTSVVGGASHYIYTAANILASNTFQHVALTYSRISGQAAIYWNGNVVASQNLGIFTPWTSMNVLIGRQINNFDPPSNQHFLGEEDEMSLYGRALSPSEIKAIYSDGINGNPRGGNGKFDPTVSFAGNLAEATIVSPGNIPVTISGNNTNWQVYSVTGLTPANGGTLIIAGVEPGMLLDSMVLTNVTVTASNVTATLFVTNVTASTFYLTFTEDTNLTTTPIKFAAPPFVPVIGVSTNLVVNGSFETPVTSFIMPSMTSGLTGWTIAYGNIDLLSSGYWQSVAGQNIDLNGNQPGGIYQDITTVPGQVYTLRFAYTANPGILPGMPTNMILSVLWDGNLVTNAVVVNTNTVSSMGWRYANLQVIGTGLDRLAFNSSNTLTGSAGPVLDDVSLTAISSISNLYYLPEQDMSAINGTSAFGCWALEIQDDRAGATNNATLLGWQLGFTFANTNLPPPILFYPPGVPITNVVAGAAVDPIKWLGFMVPANVVAATNRLITSEAPVSLLYSVNNPPTTGQSGDAVLIANSVGPAAAVLTPTTVPPLVPGGAYYLGVQNNNGFDVTNVVEVDFDYTPTSLVSGQPQTNTIAGGAFAYYAITVPTNADFATNILLFATGPVNLWFNQANKPIGVNPPDYELLAGSMGGIGSPILATNTTPPLVPGQTYILAVQNPNATPVTFAVEVNFHLLVPPGGFIYYLINVPTNADFATNLLVTASGPVNLWFNETTQPTGTNAGDYELLTGATNGASVLSTVSVPTNIIPGGSYWLGVQNTNSVPVSFTLVVNFHLLPTGPIFISSITPTNISGTFGFLLAWYAPTNDLFLVQWGKSLTAPVAWNTFTNIIGYTSLTPTNGIGLFEFFDDGSQTGGFDPLRFYRLLLLTGPPPGVPQTNSVPPGGFDYFFISVPTNADIATNTLLTATGPVNLWFNQLTPPTGTNTGDYLLLGGATNGSAILSTSSAPTNIVPGGFYWLGVQNTNSFSVTISLVVNFHLLVATNNTILIYSITYTNIGGTNGFLLTWLAPTNDVFQVEWEDALLPVNWQFFANFVYYTGPLTPTNGWFSFFDDGSQTPPGLPLLRFYRIVLVGTIPSTHTNAVLISSVTTTNLAGTNGIWLAWTAPTNYLFEVQWTTNLVPAITWYTVPDILAYSTFVSPTNSLFDFFDDGSLTVPLGTTRFYRLIILP